MKIVYLPKFADLLALVFFFHRFIVSLNLCYLFIVLIFYLNEYILIFRISTFYIQFSSLYSFYISSFIAFNLSNTNYSKFVSDSPLVSSISCIFFLVCYPLCLSTSCRNLSLLFLCTQGLRPGWVRCPSPESEFYLIRPLANVSASANISALASVFDSDVLVISLCLASGKFLF